MLSSAWKYIHLHTIRTGRTQMLSLLVRRANRGIWRRWMLWFFASQASRRAPSLAFNIFWLISTWLFKWLANCTSYCGRSKSSRYLVGCPLLHFVHGLSSTTRTFKFSVAWYQVHYILDNNLGLVLNNLPPLFFFKKKKLKKKSGRGGGMRIASLLNNVWARLHLPVSAGPGIFAPWKGFQA
jgi:hypothetical protein